MQLDWQLTAALGIVALTVLYVARLAWKSLRGKSSGCGGCGSCSASKTGDGRADPLVTLGEPDEIASGP